MKKKFRFKRKRRRSRVQSADNLRPIPVGQIRPWKDHKLFATKMRLCPNLPRNNREMIPVTSFYRKRRAISATDLSPWDSVAKMSKTMNSSSSMRRPCSNSSHKRRRKRRLLSSSVLPIAIRMAKTLLTIHLTRLNPRVVPMTRNKSRFSKTTWHNPAWAKMCLPCNTGLIICQVTFSEWPPRSTNLHNQTIRRTWELLSLATQIISTRIPLVDQISSQVLKTTTQTSVLAGSKRASTI